MDRLTDEAKVLRESVDELKTSFEWALRNAQITVQFDDAPVSTLGQTQPDKPPAPVFVTDV